MMDYFSKNPEDCEHPRMIPYIMTAVMDKESLDIFNHTEVVESIDKGNVITHIIVESLICPECGFVVNLEHNFDKLNPQ